MIFQIPPRPSVPGTWNVGFVTWNEESYGSLPEVEMTPGGRTWDWELVAWGL